MRWNASFTKELETKYVKRFAWIPVLLSDDTYIWLESYYKKSRFESGGYAEDFLPPISFGGYIRGPLWVTKGRAKTKEELIQQIDNYYEK